MKAIILAAGRGSRMKTLTDDKPKCLVSLRGRPLLDWQLDALGQAGISDIGIVTGYRQELLADRGLTTFHNARWDQSNMVTSLACAREWLNDGPCVVSYSDIFYSASAISSLIASPASLAITYDPNWLSVWSRRFENPLEDAETFRLHEDGTLAEIGQRPQTVSEVQGQYMGLLRFMPSGWAEIEHLRGMMDERERDKMDMTGTLQRVVRAGRIRIAAVPYEGEWGEVDSASDLASYDPA